MDGEEGAQEVEVRVRRKLRAGGGGRGGLLARGARLVLHEERVAVPSIGNSISIIGAPIGMPMDCGSTFEDVAEWRHTPPAETLELFPPVKGPA
ncbi:hypothetical protein GCM10010330_67140 [Streptomyces tendae]|nr:hypothetical protein GCM10010330_67140 [Streptomyces tendae]